MRRVVSPRDRDEEHRPATPLELFFDLVFVVAVASAGVELHQDLAEGRWHGLLGYLMAFLAIWWAWVNYTWYASSYDNDDVVFRLLTFVIMTGALVFAASIPDFSADGQSVSTVLGYVVMRVGMVALWLRAARDHPQGRATALYYAAGIAFAQVLWVARLACPPHLAVATFFAIFLIEVLVPVVAERQGRTHFHPQHIAERYFLFAIIVLGEEILSLSTVVQGAIAEGLPARFGLLLAGALLIVFSAWWWYFSGDYSELADSDHGSWLFGYGHFVVYLSLAAIGSALAAGVDVALGTAQASGRSIALVLAVALAGYGVSTRLMSSVKSPDPVRAATTAAFAAGVLLCSLIDDMPTAVLAMGLVMAGALAAQVVRTNQVARRAAEVT